MSDTPETQEAVERWQQGKINVFDEMARLERERNSIQDQRDFCMGEIERLRGELKQKTGYWESLIHWLEQVQKAFEGQDREDLTQLYMRGPFAGWSMEKMVRLADELWENEQRWPLRGDKK